MECSEEMERLRGRHDPDNSHHYKDAHEKHARLLVQEETYWRQRAQMHWLQQGDLNTKFFHMSASVRSKVKKIEKLINGANMEVKTQPEICEEAKAYFDKLFKANMSSHEPVLSLITPKITQDDNDRLLAPLTKEEIHEALLQMHPDKAPGPDNFNPTFYEHFWSVRGDNIFEAANEWLEKDCLDKCVSEEKSAFVEGRSIIDNALIAIEVVHALKRKTKGFQVNYSVLVNFEKVDPIIPGRGLRQGDPLSPYLLILVTEGLSTLIKKYVARGDIHGVKVCRGAPPVSHMLFADDCFLFCRSNLEENRKLMDIIKTYEVASGQEVNMSKSEVIFSRNLSMAAQEDLSRIMGVKHVLGTGTYLGLPSMVGRSKKSTFAYIKDQIWKRINSWRGRALSRAGKEVLIKSVLQSIPSYVMSVYIIPETTIKEIERMFNSFWWGGGSNNRGIKWLVWDRMTFLKEYGGLGFRNLQLFNMAMVAKRNSLVEKVYKARYFPNSSFLASHLCNNPSYAWRSIWKSRQVLLNGCRRKIGDGTNIKVMNEPWLKKEDGKWMQSPQEQGVSSLHVNQLMLANGKVWDNNKRINWCGMMICMKIIMSGYNMLLQPKIGAVTAQGREDWKALWKIHAPPKTKHLMWRICKGCLPTRLRLKDRNVQCPLSCPICENDAENDWNFLYECENSRNAWQRAGLEHIITQHAQQANTTKECILHLCQFGDRNEAGKVATLIWFLWQNKNNWIWNLLRLEVPKRNGG
ncbi:ribonuclease H [Trifolium pratense]|uniref:Ribonuclease H n=1 Tax=Trifolium pratense TaxID=57577 RepID=A0A2K3P1T7_TRIPR|nr:ribonuclease H [Trifolium pratense]